MSNRLFLFSMTLGKADMALHAPLAIFAFASSVRYNQFWNRQALSSSLLGIDVI
jgi:hypothetical protein